MAEHDAQPQWPFCASDADLRWRAGITDAPADAPSASNGQIIRLDPETGRLLLRLMHKDGAASPGAYVTRLLQKRFRDMEGIRTR